MTKFKKGDIIYNTSCGWLSHFNEIKIINNTSLVLGTYISNTLDDYVHSFPSMWSLETTRLAAPEEIANEIAKRMIG